jgi:hypothetical protein
MPRRRPDCLHLGLLSLPLTQCPGQPPRPSQLIHLTYPPPRPMRPLLRRTSRLRPRMGECDCGAHGKKNATATASILFIRRASCRLFSEINVFLAAAFRHLGRSSICGNVTPSNKRWSILPMPWPRPGGEILFQWFRAGRLVDELSDLMKRRRPAVQAEIDRVYNEHLASRQSEGRRKSGWQQAITMPKSQAADGRAILSAIPRGKPVSCTHQDQSQNALRP